MVKIVFSNRCLNCRNSFKFIHRNSDKSKNFKKLVLKNVYCTYKSEIFILLIAKVLKLLCVLNKTCMANFEK